MGLSSHLSSVLSVKEASHLASLKLDFLICVMETLKMPFWQGDGEISTQRSVSIQ